MAFDIQALLKSIATNGIGNKSERINMPSQDAIQSLIGGDKHQMSEKAPIGGSSTQLPPTNPVAMPVQNVTLPKASALINQASQPQTIESTTPIQSSGEVQSQPPAQWQFDPQTIDTTTPVQASGQVQQRPLDLPVTPSEPPDYQLFRTPEGKVLRVGNNTAPDPGDEETYLKHKMADAQSYRPTNKFADILSVAGQSLSNSLNGTNRAVMTLDQMRQQRDMAKYAPRLQQIAADKAQADADAAKAANIAHIKAETENIPIKSAIDRMWREGQISEAAARALQQQENLKERKRIDFFRSHRAFDPANASESDKNALAEFGETPESMGKYDRTAEHSRQIGNTLYQWDQNSNSWKNSGVSDPNKATVKFAVTDPDGTKEVFDVSSEKAAELRTGLERQGYQIQSQERMNNARIDAAGQRQTNAQKFTAQESVLRRQFADAEKKYNVAIAGKKAADAAQLKIQLIDIANQIKAAQAAQKSGNAP